MEITILHGFESKTYAGPLRPFINWMKYSAKSKPQIGFKLILFKCSPRLVEHFSSIFKENIVQTKNKYELLKIIRASTSNIIMSDDYYPRLKLISSVTKNMKVMTAIYVQFLYGMHSVSRLFGYDQLPFSEKIGYKVSMMIPFKLLVWQYVKMLEKHMPIIVNSRSSQNFLYYLYGIYADEIVYPPTDIEIFKPRCKPDSDTVLVYLGSSGGDVSVKFLDKLVTRIVSKGFNANLFGNKVIGSSLEKRFRRVKYFKNIRDEELANLYSNALVTLCPQTWELFGYVATESMSCGTPVLAFNYFGHAETIINGKTGLLPNNKGQFMENLDLVLDNKIDFDRDYIKDYAVNFFSTEQTVEKLKARLKNVIQID